MFFHDNVDFINNSFKFRAFILKYEILFSYVKIVPILNSFDEQTVRPQVAGRYLCFMDVAIVYNSGIGNALLTVPLLRKLRSGGHRVTGIFLSRYGVEQILAPLHLPGVMLSGFPLLNGMKKPFDVVLLDYFSTTRSNVMKSLPRAGKVVLSKKMKPVIRGLLGDKVVYTPPADARHEAAHYLNMAEVAGLISDTSLHLTDFEIETSFEPLPRINGRYFVIQLTAGNNQAPYKTWPLANWKALLRYVKELLPGMQVVLAGDENETGNARQLSKNHPEIIDLTGKTTLPDLFPLLRNAAFFLGPDSGLMHLSAVLGTPTFTIWGGSDYRRYGYGFFDDKRHVVVADSPDCWPCNLYFAPNTTRVTDPLACPDFTCITGIGADDVAQRLTAFIHSNAIAVT